MLIIFLASSLNSYHKRGQQSEKLSSVLSEDETSHQSLWKNENQQRRSAILESFSVLGFSFVFKERKHGPIAQSVGGSDCGSEGRSPHGSNQSKAIFSVHLNSQECSGGSELYSSINWFAGVSIM
jgi:hypothetical protein